MRYERTMDSAVSAPLGSASEMLPLQRNTNNDEILGVIEIVLLIAALVMLSQTERTPSADLGHLTILPRLEVTAIICEPEIDRLRYRPG